MPPNISLCVLVVNKERHIRLEQHVNDGGISKCIFNYWHHH